VVVEITQSFRPDDLPGARYRGGCTMLIDLPKAQVRYLVRKKVENAWRLDQQMGFAAAHANDLRANYFSEPSAQDEPFALLHMSHRLEQDDGEEPGTQEATR
jgi:hypothetical protein